MYHLPLYVTQFYIAHFFTKLVTMLITIDHPNMSGIVKLEQAEKEDYAHRYARELHERLSKQDVLPFAPIIDDQSLISDGLKGEWFCLP